MRPEKAWRTIEVSIKNAIQGDVSTLYTKQAWQALNKLLSKLKVELETILKKVTTIIPLRQQSMLKQEMNLCLSLTDLMHRIELSG
jgi:hypothetical protein